MEPMVTNEHLIVIVPGIGGSVLQDSAGRVVWGSATGIAATIPRPRRLELLCEPALTPVGLLPTIGVAPPLVVPGYDKLVTAVRRQLRIPADQVDVAVPGRPARGDARILLFPYDFRLGVAAAAEQLSDAVESRLSGLTRDQRQRRVIVIGHSMGGLVARYWLGPLNGAAVCRALITVGTPYGGAPKALDWLVNGVRAGRLPLRTATDVLRSWPSVFDLLPRYPAVLVDGEARYPYELNTVVDGSFTAAARASYENHLMVDREWRQLDRHRPEIVALFGRGHATPHRAWIEDGHLQVSRTRSPEWLPNQDWLGDGTVPAIAALPNDDTDDRRGWQAVTQRHLPMATAPGVLDTLRNYAGESMQPIRGTAPTEPWLGLDLNDLEAAGTPIPVRARLWGGTAPPGIRVTASIRTLDSVSAAHTIDLDGVPGGSWYGEIPSQPPGDYHVTVEASGSPDGLALWSSDVVAVVEPS
jgi:pimeloyl-ACP methyl ester carboxylesterase